jgi:hypothetical protein
MQVLDSLAVMGLAVGDQDTLGQQPGEDGVQLNGPLAGPKFPDLDSCRTSTPPCAAGWTYYTDEWSVYHDVIPPPSMW